MAKFTSMCVKRYDPMTHVEIGYADTLGSGVRNLFKYSKAYSGADPELIEGDVFRTIIPLPRATSTDASSNSTGGDTESDVDIVNDIVSDTVSDVNTVNDIVNDTDTDTVTLILAAISDNSCVTIAGLAAMAGKSQSTVARGIKSLKESGAIERVGSDKTGYWKVLR